MSEGNNFCINLKYAPGVKRERVDDDQIRMGENFFRLKLPDYKWKGLSCNQAD